MALVLADRVRETTTVTGTGTATLLGAVSGYQSFSAVGNANTTYYVIANQSASEWEVGIGTYTASGTLLSRTTVLSSSNSGSLVNFSAGTKDVFVDYPASKAVFENASGNIDSYPITGGTIDNTIIGGTTPAAGTFTTLTATGQTSLGGDASNPSFRANAVSGVTRWIEASGSVSGTPQFSASSTGSATGINFVTRGASGFNFSTNTSASTVQLAVSHTASAVNYVQVTGAATGGTPTFSAQGSDSTVSFTIAAKGFGATLFTSQGGSARQFQINDTVSAVNNIAVSGSATNNVPTYTARGSDTNIGMAFKTQGTGAIDLAAGSSGVNISNGGTVTAITRTGFGSGYTSIPTVAVSAPTTAGGVQATLNVFMSSNSATIVSGGTGYTAGDVLTVVGGTGTAVQITVTTVSAGVITVVPAPTVVGYYSVLPTNPVSVTGGTGSGATFNLSYYFGGATVNNAGSGYVEQPTVTFSGGGGSGAAAYASVGSTTKIQTLASPLEIHTPSGVAFRIADIGVTSAAYWTAYGGTAIPELRASGAGIVSVTGANSLQFRTNTSTQQFNIANTASAVNYVQVTGGSTGNAPYFLSQGSDTNVNLWYGTKGTGYHAFFTAGNGANVQFLIANTASAVNYVQTSGSTTGFGAKIFSAGSDTNIPLVLQPKGTGALQAQQTDSTATGGNARGANAVDWQTTRSAATQVASGAQSVVAGGSSNRATGSYGVSSGGNNNTSSGFGSALVGGNTNTSSGAYSFVGAGESNTASNYPSAVVAGSYNTAAGFFNFIGGGFTNSATSGSVVTTQSGTMNGTTAVTLSGSNASIKVGQYITGTSIAGNTYVAAISGTSLTLSTAASGSSTSTLSFYTPHGVVVGGGNNRATGSYSFIGGGGDAGTAANRNVASGDWSFVGGGRTNIASGHASVVVGGGSDGSSSSLGSVASGTASFIGGGLGSSASGTGSSVLGGYQHNANGQLSSVLGGRYGNTRSIQANFVFPTNAIVDVSGVSQGALLVLGRQTTNATPTVLASNSGSATTNNQVILPNNSAYYFRGEVVSGVTGGGNTKGWFIEGVIKRGANAASTALVGTPTVTSLYADAGAATWTIAVTADTTNGGLKVTFTGQAGTTIRTVAQIRTTEMTY